MLGMTIDPRILAGLLAFSTAVTLLTNWLAAGLRRPAWPRRIHLADGAAVIASLVWIVFVYVAGVIATRYIERIEHAILGYLVFGLGAVLLSWIRAILFQRMLTQQRKRVQGNEGITLGFWNHLAIYLLFPTVVFLSLSWLLQRRADPFLLVPLGIGAILPDLESRTSALGRLFPCIFRPLKARVGYLQAWHTLAANALVAALTIPLIWLFDVQVWYLISLGFLSHLMLDLLTPQGIMLFWPLTRTRYNVFGGRLERPGSPSERWLAVGLAVTAVLLLLTMDIGPPAPPSTPAPSYDQTLERYYSMRGNNQMFAYVEGTWQATGRRMSGWLEILNVAGESFTMLDRYDGKVFTGGRGAHDNLYLNRITLRAGPSIRVKPSEIHLKDQHLAAGLAVLYEMQREPGLEHIYVSGDVVVPVLPGTANPALLVDYAQTSLRRIQLREPGHYTLHYLTASDLIALGNVLVETADLVIVATYVSPSDGPTPTPLPPPPNTPEPTP
jgi:inner membrane protein